jgi:phosphatidylinositol glycan class P protein
MSPPEISDEKQSQPIDDSRGSARIVSLRESKQPFPPLPADGFATTMHDVPNNSYPGLDYSDMLSPTTDDLAEEEEDPDFHSSYSLDNQSFSDASMESDEEAAEDGIAMHHPFRQSSSSLHGPNAFAPPFYNRPPTPLPPSPSLTSLLRPPFSTTTSRPTTPDSSDVETPNDTEAAVAKSARRATTVPRASPKVPTYEYYGFVLYLASSLAFCESNPMRCRK